MQSKFIQIALPLFMCSALAACSTSDGLTLQGEAYVASKQYDKAVDSFSAAIKQDPNNGKAYSFRSLANQNLGNYQKAADDASKAIELHQDEKYLPILYKGRGTSNFYLKQYQQAADDFQKAMELDSDIDVYETLGIAHYRLKQYQETVDDCSEAIKMHPKNADVYDWRGLAYYQLKEYKKAVADFSKAIELNSPYTHARCFRGLSCLKLGQRDLAKKDLEATIVECSQLEKKPQKEALVYYIRAQAYDGLGKRDLAKSNLEKAKLLGYEP